jgi:hypothetical protein
VVGNYLVHITLEEMLVLVTLQETQDTLLQQCLHLLFGYFGLL